MILCLRWSSQNRSNHKRLESLNSFWVSLFKFPLDDIVDNSLGVNIFVIVISTKQFNRGDQGRRLHRRDQIVEETLLGALEGRTRRRFGLWARAVSDQVAYQAEARPSQPYAGDMPACLHRRADLIGTAPASSSLNRDHSPLHLTLVKGSKSRSAEKQTENPELSQFFAFQTLLSESVRLNSALSS